MTSAESGRAGGDPGAGMGREEAREKARSRRLSALRVVCFLGAVAGAVLGFSTSPWFLYFVALPSLAAFVAVVILHGRVLDRLEELESRVAFLRESDERRAGRRRERKPPEPHEEYGQGLSNPPPPAFELERGVADDLDLLHGPRSLFGFLDASSTWFGAQRLQGMVLRPLLDRGAIEERQEAVRAAAGDAGLREGILLGLFPLRRLRMERVPEALAARLDFLRRRWLALWANLAGSAAPVLLAFTFLDLRMGAFLLLSLIGNLVTVGWFSRRSNPARDRLLSLRPLLEGFTALRRPLRATRLHSTAFQRVHAVLDRAEGPGRKLARWIRILSLHELGIVFEALNILLLLELRVLRGAERLFEKHRALLREGALALGEAEALVSLSLPLVEQPEFSLPEAVEGVHPLFQARGLGHPLIEPERVVTNDVSLDERAPIAIVTGSNMSGKSTLLKAVGMNLVLAGMGGPVQAREMRWTPLALYTDLNVRDSLDDGKSYFAVEVERVQRILRHAAESPFLLGLFDELYRGTNSAERQSIAMALLAHLRRTGGLYLVATHDLLITRLSEEIPGVVNFHFREDVDGGALRFDYRLRPGPAPTRNAIRVLEAKGYPPALVQEARERLSRLESEGEGGDGVPGMERIERERDD